MEELNTISSDNYEPLQELRGWLCSDINIGQQ